MLSDPWRPVPLRPMMENPYESPNEAGYEAPRDPREDEERVRRYFIIFCIALGVFFPLSLWIAACAGSFLIR